MLELAQNFEQVAIRFNMLVLVIPGLILVLVGLFLWLGGLGLSRILVAVLGAVTGGMCGMFLIGKSIAAAVILAVAAVVIAILFKKVFITLLAANLVAVVVFTLLNASNLAQSGPTYPMRYSAAGDEMTVSRSLQAATDFASDFTNTIKYTCSQMPAYNWAIIAAAFVLLLVAGFFLWRFTSALCCAFMGTVCIFAGMILLLIFKGSLPITAVCSRSPFYLSVFAAMIAFGTVEQLLLCRMKSKKQKAEEQKEKTDPHKPEKKYLDWRTS